MRRVVVLLIVALIGAGFAGRFVSANAVSVNGSALPASQLRAELDAIRGDTGSFTTCFLFSELGVKFSSTSVSMNAAAVTSWTQLQIEGLAIENYMTSQLGWRPSSADLGRARTAWANDLEQFASAAHDSCGQSAASAISAMPKSFVDAQVLANAASLALLDRLNGVTPLTQSGVTSYYQAHQNYYDTLCVSVAIVPQANLNAFAQAQQKGWTISRLAHTFSADHSASVGGVYGCYGPSNANYSVFRSYVYGQPLNAFATTPREVSNSSGIFGAYVAVTKRTTTDLAHSLTQVILDVRNQNKQLASVAEGRLLRTASIVIDPSFGRWVQSKATVSTLLTPLIFLVPNSGAGLAL